MVRGIRLGEILVEQGLLTPVQVGQVLKQQKRGGRPFGVLAERMFGVDPQDIERAWVAQYARISPAVDVASIAVDAECLAVVDRRQAWQFQCAPVCRDEGELVVLTDQRHLAKTLRFAAATFREPTYIRLVERDALREFLMQHYPVPTALADFAVAR